MRIDQIHCSPDVAEKLIIKHHVEVEEAEEVLWGNPYIRFRERGKRKTFTARLDKRMQVDI